MVNRKSNSPWGSSYKEGLPSTAVNDTVDIDQNVRATITTGVIDVATGQWEGIKVSDSQFIGITLHPGIPNTGVTLSPDTTSFPSINMKGYKDIFIAIKPTNGGNYATNAVVGPVEVAFGGLTPVNSGVDLRGCVRRNDFDSILIDSADSLTADVWNIFVIQDQLKDQENFQFKVVNGSGGNSDIEVAFMRVV